LAQNEVMAMKLELIRAYERIVALAGMAGFKLFIWGAGRNGRQLYDDLHELGLAVFAFVDNVHEKLDGEEGQARILPPEAIWQLSRGTFFVLCSMASADAYAHARRRMEEHGLAEGEDFADFGIDSDRRML
jgi:hypothetical protein